MRSLKEQILQSGSQLNVNINGYLKFNLAALSAQFFQIDKNNYRTMFFCSKQVCLPKISLIVQKK